MTAIMMSLRPISSSLRRWTMPKRVSLKGKGADIFFGDDYSPTRDQPPTDVSASDQPTNEPAVEAVAPPEARPDVPPETSRVRAPTRARVHARTDASTSADMR